MKRKTIVDLIKDLLHVYSNWRLYNRLVETYFKSVGKRRREAGK
jgi:hypothetical protein